MPSISLTNPIAGTVATAGLITANNNALVTLLNAGLDTANWATGKIFAPSKLTQEAATTGQGLVWNGTIWAPATPPGAEINYTQITASVNVVSTTEATGTTIISPGAVTFDGAPVKVEFYSSPVFLPSVAGGQITVNLFEASTQITRLTFAQNAAAAACVLSLYGVYRFTPSAGAHTYTITSFVSSTTGTPSIGAGSGGTGGNPPAFVRFTKV